MKINRDNNPIYMIFFISNKLTQSLLIIELKFLIYYTNYTCKILGCYAQKFGVRGYGYLGMSSLGLMSDIRDKEWQRYFLLSVQCSHTFVFVITF